MVSYLPKTLNEALRIRAAENVIPYGGGTDLMIEADPDAGYLFLHKISELRRIESDSGFIRIGAGCTFTEIAEHPDCPAILREAVLQIAAPAICNLGTIGGNLGNGSPKADSAPALFVCGATVRLASESGGRSIPIQQLYLGRKKLDLRPDELITEVLIPRNGLDNYYYKKVGAREALAISRVSFAAVMDIEGGKIRRYATAFGAVSDVIVHRPDIDAMLEGKAITEAKAVKADYLDMYDADIAPIRGRVSAEYRKGVCMNLLQDFLASNGI